MPALPLITPLIFTMYIFFFQATEKDITEYFGKFGEVASVNLKMDQMTGRSRGFAFVVFVEVDTLTTVLSQDHAIKGKKVAVKKVNTFFFDRGLHYSRGPWNSCQKYV